MGGMMSEPSKIKVVLPEGYYVAYVHPEMSESLRAIDKVGGRNWRRVKREVRRARLKVRREMLAMGMR